MDHAEMVAAAEVRALAAKLRSSDLKKAMDAAGFDGATQQNRDNGEIFVAGWLSQNTVSLYVPEAYGLIRDVAMQIREL